MNEAASLRDVLTRDILEAAGKAGLSGREAFARHYFSRLATVDLEDLAVTDLVEAAVQHLALAQRRDAGETRIAVISPKGNGAAAYSLVQIVTDDIPFLVDSARMEVNRRGLSVLLTIHPLFSVRRDDQGQLVEISPGGANGGQESFLCLQITRCGTEQERAALTEGLHRVLLDVALAVRDWSTMRDVMQKLAEDVVELGLQDCDLDETRAFLNWLTHDHFTFLGYRQYDLLEREGEDVLRVVPGTGLGILAMESEEVSTAFSVLPPEIRKFARLPVPLVLTKGNSRATVHRPGYVDYVGIKRFDEHGEVIGEHRFLGLYTSSAYYRDLREIPLLRQKVAGVLAQSGLDPNSYSGKALTNILRNFPRDELFQLDEQLLFETAMGILGLEDRQRVRLFVMPDTYGRFVSCLVYMPRERYDPVLRNRVQELLKERYAGESVEFTTTLGEHPMACVYFVIRTPHARKEDVNIDALEDEIAYLAQSWHQRLRQALAQHHGEARGNALFRKYQAGFPVGYREVYDVAAALSDIECLEALADDPAAVDMRLSGDPGRLHLRLYRATKAVPLHTALPMLENFGLRIVSERPYCLRVENDICYWIHDFDAGSPTGGRIVMDGLEERFRDAFVRVWSGAVENDGFNALITAAGLDWQHVAVLRAYCRYLLQVKVPFSQAYTEATLARNAAIAHDLVEYFVTRFDPAQTERNTAMAQIREQILDALDAVASLDEDRILRNFLAAIDASVRTNFFQGHMRRDPPFAFAIKLRPAEIPGVPLPHPMFEIFICATHVEGVHLRGGKVARGGLRWSDRLEDYRTEVLGLVKAQMVKNAVIVPVGAKGGFVLKHTDATAQTVDREQVIHAYRTFVQGLLDLTDNLVDGAVVPPAGTVRHDEDDPYLVVAADKGTATFSDIANELALANHFWLGDAFASGGSAGYDHKKMAITARGAWESVRRHFTELGIDVQNTPFTVTGIGDMAGDVFGNGMLLSPQIKLIAAFNHRHIFIDPDPDPASSMEERKRLFETPRSQWTDYDRKVLSQGGEIFDRRAKHLRLSEPAQKALGANSDSMTPNELIRTILRAPVDLLWNGGIGTFVKASHETHADADDRSNDAVRIDASELRCRVVGEGGNLGFTQRARIEFSSRGGLINCDFIDNSGGVDCSDREVNMKILLGLVTSADQLTIAARNDLLAGMTDEVASLVLRNNYLQTRAISYALAQTQKNRGTYLRMLRYLERHADLDRSLEHLPTDDELTERLRGGMSLTRPELAIVEAYTKLGLYAELLASDLPDDPDCAQVLETYFPAAILEQYRSYIKKHPLRREIVATVLANRITHSLDFNFLRRVGEQSGRAVSEMVRAFIASSAIFDFNGLQQQIESLDNIVPASVQTGMMQSLGRLIERASFWLLRNRPQPLAIADTIGFFRESTRELEINIDQLVSGVERRRHRAIARQLRSNRVPEATAASFARLDAMFSVLDIVDIRSKLRHDMEFTARIYFEVGRRFDTPWLRDQIAALPSEHHLVGIAKSSLYTDLYHCQRILAEVALEHNTLRTPKGRIERWLRAQGNRALRVMQILEEARGNDARDLATLMVAVREIEQLATNHRND